MVVLDEKAVAENRGMISSSRKSRRYRQEQNRRWASRSVTQVYGNFENSAMNWKFIITISTTSNNNTNTNVNTINGNSASPSCGSCRERRNLLKLKPNHKGSDWSPILHGMVRNSRTNNDSMMYNSN